MTDVDADALGPIDFLVVEFPGNRFDGRIVPALVDLIARGLVRVLDLAFVARDASGALTMAEIVDLDAADLGPLQGLGGFLTDLVSEEDLLAAGAELAPESSAAVIIWENTWAAPFATAVRASGGEVVASGRLPADEVLDLLADAS